jgi:hypothetical protein
VGHSVFGDAPKVEPIVKALADRSPRRSNRCNGALAPTDPTRCGASHPSGANLTLGTSPTGRSDSRNRPEAAVRRQKRNAANRRRADVPDRGLRRLNWAESEPSVVVLGRTGVCAKAAVSLPARNKRCGSSAAPAIIRGASGTEVSCSQAALAGLIGAQSRYLQPRSEPAVTPSPPTSSCDVHTAVCNAFNVQWRVSSRSMHRVLRAEAPSTWKAASWTCPAFVESVFDFTLPALRTEAG